MKLHMYEYLHLLNQNFQHTLRILQRLEKCPGLRRDFLRAFQVMIEEIRAQTNFELTDRIHQHEERDWYRFGKLRRRWEKQFEDPDDVYIEVQEREEERRRQGTAARLGILPHVEPPQAPRNKRSK